MRLRLLVVPGEVNDTDLIGEGIEKGTAVVEVVKVSEVPST